MSAVRRFVFFFSSRRRHTRSLCDWSSDVCSSDLVKTPRMTGPARVFDCEEDCLETILAGHVKRGDVLVIRYEGPKGGPGMRDRKRRRVGKECRSRWPARA